MLTGHSSHNSLKPIFHCDAKLLASALGVGGNAKIYQRQNIPTCWYILALPPTPNLKFALPPTPTPDASQWNIGGVGSSGVGHVYFMYISCIFHVVCASFSALATQPSFQWNMGLKGHNTQHSGQRIRFQIYIIEYDLRLCIFYR